MLKAVPQGWHRALVLKLMPEAGNIPPPSLACSFADGATRVCQGKCLRNSPSFQRSIDHGQYVIELHAWLSQEIDSLQRSFTRKPPNGSCGISPAQMRTKSSVNRGSSAMRIREVSLRTSEWLCYGVRSDRTGTGESPACTPGVEWAC